MKEFIFKSAHYDNDNQTIELGYAYDDGQNFVEKIYFPGAKHSLTEQENMALDHAIRQLHLAAGISYYKAYCQSEMHFEIAPLAKEEADFFYKFYLNGLGEFAVENDIDLTHVINFPVGSNHHLKPSELILPDATVVPIGGGKDSVVSLEILKAAKKPLRMIAINAGKPIKDVMAISKGTDVIHIRRALDPALFELNDNGAMNGHVPITGILSFIMACGSILYGYDSVIMSNEGSASVGNMEYAGIEVNHQYSKSLEFELDFEKYIRKTTLGNFKYFSLLRPLNETGIAALFAAQDQYFDTFKSCNRNFHIDEGMRKYGWCCDCPKCRFVFLALSPFIEREKLIDIFGKNMLDDQTQEDGFRELCGLKGHKPFECVGEIEECQLIMKSLSMSPWADDQLVKHLSPELDIEMMDQTTLKKQALHFKYEHNIPTEYLEFLNAFIKTVG